MNQVSLSDDATFFNTRKKLSVALTVLTASTYAAEPVSFIHVISNAEDSIYIVM